MSATHYTRSTGAQVEIATIPYPHLKSARDKLVRDRIDDSRDAEITAMSARIDALDAEFEAEANTQPGAA